MSAPQVFSLLIKPFNDSSAKGKRNCRNPRIVKTRTDLRKTNINPIQKLCAQNSSVIWLLSRFCTSSKNNMPWMVVSLLFYLLIFWESYLSWLYIKEKAITPCFPTFMFVSKIGKSNWDRFCAISLFHHVFKTRPKTVEIFWCNQRQRNMILCMCIEFDICRAFLIVLMTSADKEIVICDSFDGYVLDNSKAYVNLARKLVKKISWQIWTANAFSCRQWARAELLRKHLVFSFC